MSAEQPAAVVESLRLLLRQADRVREADWMHAQEGEAGQVEPDARELARDALRVLDEMRAAGKEG